MPQILTNALLKAGLRTEFDDTYMAVRNRQADSRLAQVMDLGINTETRVSQFGYIEAAPHFDLWKRGDTVPTGAMDSVNFEVPVYEWAKRIPWHKNDRKDEQTQTLFDAARMTAESAALVPERLFFDVLRGTTDLLPDVPLAPDGLDLYAAGSGAGRFQASGGNIVSTSGVSLSSQILADYFSAMARFAAFKDRAGGQPLWAPSVIDQGVIIIHSSEDVEVFEEAFLQRRQGRVLGTDAGTTPSNIVQDASRDVDLWGTSRIPTGEWYIFLKGSPKKAVFHLMRQDVMEASALEGDDNSDHTRDTGMEYLQWEMRSGAGAGLPYGTIQVA